MIPDAEALVRDQRAAVRRATTRLYEFLVVDQACSAYVKTIYIGFEIEGDLVAALYPHRDHVEIAMALPETTDDPLLIDATHLTWKTLPVAAIVKTAKDCERTVDLLALAVRGIRSGEHTVNRSNEYFRGRKRRLSHNPVRK